MAAAGARFGRRMLGRRMLGRRMLAGAALASAALTTAAARAGPPFATDDPVPVETGHWEVYGFSSRLDADDDKSGDLLGVEVNYGAAPDLQLHLIVPLAFDDPVGGPFKAGFGDIELGAKYLFIDAGPRSWQIQAATFPLLEVPAGKSTAGLGAGQLRAYLPLWLQRDFGAWTTYGGGGYWINPGAGNRDYWFAGWLLQRQLSRSLAVGGELFYQTADEVGGRDGSGFDIGLIWDVNAHYHLLLSAGRALHNVQDNRLSYYIGLQHTF